MLRIEIVVLTLIVVAIAGMIFDPADVQANLSSHFKEMMGPEGQQAIADYKINGEQLFFPNAGR